MKTIVLLAITLLCLSQARSFACSFRPEAFCENINQHHPNYHVLTGQIIEVIPNGVLFKIMEVVRGAETRDTVMIWNDKPFECNGPWARWAIELGEVGDTVMIAVPKIDSLENAWERLNDYRAPSSFAYTSSLQLKNGILKGIIAGTMGTVPRSVVSFDYEQFKMVAIQQRDCPMFVSSNDFSLESTFQVHPNPFDNQLFVNFPNANFSRLKYIITNINGQALQQGILLENQTIQTNDLPKGMYLLVISNTEGVIFSRKKLVKA